MMKYFVGISDLPHDVIFQELSLSHDLHSEYVTEYIGI